MDRVDYLKEQLVRTQQELDIELDRRRQGKARFAVSQVFQLVWFYDAADADDAMIQHEANGEDADEYQVVDEPEVDQIG